jgi:hypothetical protein
MPRKLTPRAVCLFRLWITLSAVAAPVYLFVVPAIVAVPAAPLNGYELAFGAFMYIQMWMFSVELAYRALASVYGLKRSTLLPVFRMERVLDAALGSTEPVRRQGERPPDRTPSNAIFVTILSYLIAVYGFALLFAAISNRNPNAFTGGVLSLGSAFYFSFVTATTVGYGDIAPISCGARAATVIELAVALFYGLFLFSVLAGAARESSSASPAPKGHGPSRFSWHRRRGRR